MNKQALSKFAPGERRRLREAVQKRLAILGITEKSKFNAIQEWLIEQDGIIVVNNKSYTDYKRSTFEQLFKEYQQVGYDTLVEEIAYTWFNRLIAIRYMEVRDVLPDYVKILGNNDMSNQPEILNDYSYLSLDKAEIESLKMNNQEEAAYRKLFLAAANKLGDVMPFLFEKLQDWTELVLPERMLEPGGIIERVVTNEGLTNSFQDGVEAIGWLYQFYMSEKKSAVGGLKNNAVKKEDLPVVTQLFTPRWIVDYMNENTLGKTYDEWYETNSVHHNWEYYLKHQNSKKLLPDFDNELESLTFFDPACGSGHILVSAFDKLYDMYIEQGYRRSEIPSLILKHNLFGCDIDRRAAQIANFALYMKATEKDSRFLQKVSFKNANVIEIQDSQVLTEDEWDWLTEDKESQEQLKNMVVLFENGKQFGSLIVVPEFNYEEFIIKIQNAEKEQYGDLFTEALKLAVIEKLLPILKQAKMLCEKYDIVVTNPPYHNKYNPVLKKFMEENYKNYKLDLYSAFIYRCLEFAKGNGYVGMMTPMTWMFITRHQKLREYIINNYSISSLIQLEYSAFEEATVPICTFVIQKQNQDSVGEYIRLVDMKGDQADFVRQAIKYPTVDYHFVANSHKFSVIPGSPISYWANDSVVNCFEAVETFESIAPARKGLDTNGESEQFFRNWFEVNIGKIFGVGTLNVQQSKWYEINKGGGFRRWFGNRLDVINYENNGYILKNKRKKANIRNEDDYFKESLTYGVVTSSKFSFRKSDKSSLFDQGGPNCFPEEQYMKFILALGNSKVIEHLLTFIAPTLNFTVGDINKLPIKLPTEELLNRIDFLSDNNVLFSQKDWNSFEISWDFLKHPFVKKQNSITLLSEVYSNWEKHTESQFTQLKFNEEELNRIFIKLYGLEDTLTSEVTDEESKIRRADRLRDTQSLLSYFIGCILGRYSIDVEGLAYAGGEWIASKYKTFIPSNDGIVTFTDEKILPDEQDVYERLKEFLIAIYGQESLIENLGWIAEGLGKKESDTVEATIRNYFMKDFVKDHIKIYQNRPIYWLIDSGKQKGMQSLVYLHRYTPQTMGLAMQNHFIPLLTQWRNLVQVTEVELDSGSLSTTEKRQKTKLLNTYKKRSEELADFQDALNELARQEIPLDLDDGVKVNYQKLASVLYPIKF
ncbi:SAM-dependent methyltransferase [Bacillus cereus]|uniref:site-specific DNA-methyltransferase (adenine-specific) n=1 Tax=Bacillus cereus TaxID=1396 RepID=A0A2B2G970_BACCE|nr:MULTISPECIES: BREX-1 system adenine-specific DNA-methyltransferase PglX [Bacillus cereus group]PES90343.1 SAM-dependent methyltransferase [Bacillus cereus]PFP78547.1 SAM-dependent methyltransferase [Bacillus cereus]